MQPRKPPIPLPIRPRKHRMSDCSQKHRSLEFRKLLPNISNSPVAFPSLPASPCTLSPLKLSNLNTNTSDLRCSTDDIGTGRTLDKSKKAASYKPKALPTFRMEITVNVQLISNWGDDTEISVSEIDILNSERTPIPVSNVLPDKCNFMEDINELKKISNGIMVKDKEDQKWHHEWCHGHKPISINFKLESIESPAYIRIWNNDGPSGLQKFAVFMEKKLVAKGEVPQRFGVVLPIKADGIPMVPSLEEIFNGKSSRISINEMFNDGYGILPYDITATIVIRIFSPFDKLSPHVGLNSIELFDMKGREIIENDIESISVQGGVNLSSPYNLFKKSRRSISLGQMWLAEKLPDVPIDIIIQLKKARQISLVRFWNYNYADESNEKGAGNVGIYLEAKPYAYARLKSGNGTLKQILNGVTDVWLCDSPSLRHLTKITSINTTRRDEEIEEVDEFNDF